MRYDRLNTLSFVFIPTRRGWRLDLSDHAEVKKHITHLKSYLLARVRDPENTTEEVFQYETFLAEYFSLIADIEIGLVNWNKFKLQAFKIKHINEVHHYLMYVNLKAIE